MRRAVVRGLSRAPLSDSPALLAAAASQADSPASHDALWALDRVFRYHLHGAPRQLPGAENILRAYNETEDLQIRLRAVTLLRRVKVPNGDAFLIAVLESRERPEVRERAAEALLLYGEEKVTEALLRALQDSAPPVRFAALKALEGREDQPRVVDALTQYARREGWRRGQKRVYRLLALSAQRQGADLLYELIEGSDDAQALLALSALNSARDNIRALPLERVIRAEGRAVRVRAQAARALTWGSDPASERLLVELVTGRQAAPPEVRVAAARALGSRRTRLGQEALVEAVRDPTDPNLQRACLRSLGRYNSPSVREFLIGLRSEVSLRVRPALEEAINAIQLP
jgi:HEAT repeat protein